MTNRVLRYLQDRANKEPTEYENFYKDYGLFLKEGIVITEEHREKEEIAKLLRFDSSKCTNTQRISLPEYCHKVGAEQKEIYYLAAPNRLLAESSPYYESLKKRNIEVLFCYEPYDELVLMQLGQFLGKNIVSVEKEMRKSPDDANVLSDDSLLQLQIDELIPWMKQKLIGKVANIKVSQNYSPDILYCVFNECNYCHYR